MSLFERQSVGNNIWSHRMNQRRWIGLAVGIVVGLSIAGAAERPVTMTTDAAMWRDWLLPLPHEFTVTQQAILPLAGVAVQSTGPEDSTLAQARDDLRKLIPPAGGAPTGSSFEVWLGVVSASNTVAQWPVGLAERLRSLPNHDQAYVIEPQDGCRLLVAGLTSRGVYYGAQTLCQLLERGVEKERITIPLAKVVDWPDLDERGIWNFGQNDEIEWRASLKLNYLNTCYYTEPIRRGEPLRVQPAAHHQLLTNVLQTAYAHAMTVEAMFPHLNMWHRCKLFEAYPELQAQGAGAQNTKNPNNKGYAPCPSNPLLKQLVAEWFSDLAAKGAREVSGWVSEEYTPCSCEACKKSNQNQFELETRAIYEGWRQACRTYPDLKLRMFYGIIFEHRPDAVYQSIFKWLPLEIKVGKACHSFDDKYAAGRWIADYDCGHITPYFYTGMRLYGRNLREAIRKTRDAKYQGAYPLNNFYAAGAIIREAQNYAVAAVAEWTWNLEGRNAADFARAWAIRQRYQEPVKVAEWVGLMEPLECALMNNAFHKSQDSAYWAGIPDMLAKKQKFTLGKDMMAVFPSLDAFDKQLAVCKQTLQIAAAMPEPEWSNETRYVTAYISALKALVGMTEANAVSDKTKVQNEQHSLREAVDRMCALMDEKMDRFTAGPRKAINEIKEKHRQTWQKRLTAIEAVINEP